MQSRLEKVRGLIFVRVTRDSNNGIAIRNLCGSGFLSARGCAKRATEALIEARCDGKLCCVSEMRWRGRAQEYADSRGALVVLPLRVLLGLEFLLFIITHW